MLRRTFLHLTGVDGRLERALWSQGCSDWEVFLRDPERFDVGSLDRRALIAEVEESVQRLEKGDHAFFARRLGLHHAWRAYPEFRQRCAYLDIETDGGRDGRSITLIGLYDGADFHCWVRDGNMEGFRDAIGRYSMLVTFFGYRFDLPMLKRRFAGVRFDQIHLDLCLTLRSKGHRGGLKKIERDFGIVRPPEVDGLGGWDAVLLWRAYEWEHDERALQRLIAYNREDVVNLEVLAERTYDLCVRGVEG